MTNVNPDTPASDPGHSAAEAPAPAASAAPAGSAAPAAGLPLRGLAMVLIAVAVMLGMWGLYKLTSGGDSDTTAANDTSSAASGAATLNAPTEGQQGATPSGANSGAATPGAGESAAQATAGSEGAKADGAEGALPGNGASRAQADIPVNVFNNSGQAGYAAEQADKLKGENFKVAEVGNLSDTILVVPQTTVYYPAGDANAEALAREVAAQYYGATVPAEAVAAYPEQLSGEFTKDNAVVVVLAIPQS